MLKGVFTIQNYCVIHTFVGGLYTGTESPSPVTSLCCLRDIFKDKVQLLLVQVHVNIFSAAVWGKKAHLPHFSKRKKVSLYLKYYPLPRSFGQF